MPSEHGRLAWGLVIPTALVATALWIEIAKINTDIAAFLPVGLLAGAGGAYFFWQAALRKRWALLALMVIGPTLLSLTFRHREIGSPGLDWQVAMKAVSWVGMFGVFAVNIACIMRFCADRVMVAFGCLCILIDLSTLYSPAPLVTGLAALAMTGYFGFSCLLVSTIPERTLTLCMFWAMSLTCIVNVISPLLVPEMTFGRPDTLAATAAQQLMVAPTRFQGLFGQPNIMARWVSVFAYATLAVAYRGYVRPLIWVPNGLMALGLLLATQSRGTIIAVAVGLVLLIPRRYLVILIAASLVGGVVLATSGALPLLLGLIGRDGDANEALDMAGRADLWKFVWQLIEQRPVVGYGFNSFEVIAVPLWTGQAQAGVAPHNNYLAVLYSNGILGMIPFATGLLILLRRWICEPDPPRDFFVLSTLVCGYAEMDMPSFAAVPSQLFFTMIALDAWRRLAPAGVATHAIASTLERRWGHA